MDKLKKCGQMWIKFDENNEPEYGFVVNGKIIERFLNLSGKKVSKIILPDICEEKAYSAEELNFIVENINDKNCYLDGDLLTSYLEGQIRILPDCFKGSFKNAEQPIKIIVPFEHSLMIARGAFDDDVTPKFILKNGMQIFKIDYALDTYFDYEHKSWPLIARKEIDDIRYSGNREDYSVSKFEPYQYSEMEIQH